MELKIDKNIPIPPWQSARGITKLMRQLKVGESILLPTVGSTPYIVSKRLGIKITGRRTSEGWRVWRVE